MCAHSCNFHSPGSYIMYMYSIDVNALINTIFLKYLYSESDQVIKSPYHCHWNFLWSLLWSRWWSKPFSTIDLVTYHTNPVTNIPQTLLKAVLIKKSMNCMDFLFYFGWWIQWKIWITILENKKTPIMIHKIWLAIFVSCIKSHYLLPCYDTCRCWSFPYIPWITCPVRFIVSTLVEWMVLSVYGIMCCISGWKIVRSTRM